MNIKIERVQPPPPPKPPIHSVVVTLTASEVQSIYNGLNDCDISSYWTCLQNLKQALKEVLHEG